MLRADGKKYSLHERIICAHIAHKQENLDDIKDVIKSKKGEHTIIVHVGNEKDFVSWALMLHNILIVTKITIKNAVRYQTWLRS